jgi:O-antigen ligase
MKEEGKNISRDKIKYYKIDKRLKKTEEEIKSAYDYTLIKNLTGFLFCLFISFYFLLKKKEFELSKFIYLPIIFFTYILISCFYAPFKFEAGRNLENFLLYFLIFLVSSNLEIDKKIFYIWIVAGMIASVVGIFQFYGPRHYAISTFGNPNFFAGHIIMVLCLSFSNVLNWDFSKREKYSDFLKLLDILCLIFGFWALTVSKSRAALMALIIGISVVWYVNYREEKTFIKYFFILLCFFILAILSPKIIFWYKTNIRNYLWTGTWRMILKKPVFGWGFGNFIFFYPYFRVKEYFRQPESTPVTNHPHNEYLEIWSELGIVGLLLFLIFIFTIIIGGLKNKNSKIFLPGIIGGIISVLCDNIFSTNLRNPSTSMYFWFLLGLTFKYTKLEKIDFKFSKYIWYLIFSVSLIMVIFHSYLRIYPQIYYKNGVVAKEEGDYQEAIENYLIACKLNPYNYECWYKLAYAYGMVGDYKKAEEIYLNINKYIFPHFAKTDANLGTVYLKLGDIEKAFKYYKIAEWFNPYDEDVLCSIASIYLVYYNNIEKAVEYLKRVLKINPENIYANRTIALLKKEGKIRR